MENIYLVPGTLAVVTRPTEISTILGSCVSVILSDPSTHIGGMNHFLLARTPFRDTPNARYGDFALAHLLSETLRLGARRPSLEARIYGGAHLRSLVTVYNEIGRDNVRMAEDFLQREGIAIVERQVGGDYARKIIFSTVDLSVRHTISGT